MSTTEAMLKISIIETTWSNWILQRPLIENLRIILIIKVERTGGYTALFTLTPLKKGKRNKDDYFGHIDV